MTTDVLAVDLADGSTLVICNPEVNGKDLAQLRRELRLWARSDSHKLDETTRSSSDVMLAQISESLGAMIASGVIGNAAWAAFPRAAELLHRVTKRPRIKDAVQLAERLRSALDTDPTSAEFELVEAHRLPTNGWRARVRVNGRDLAIVTDRSGNVIALRPNTSR